MGFRKILMHLVFDFSRTYLSGRLHWLFNKVFDGLSLHIKTVVSINGIYYNIDTNNYHERGIFCFGKYEIGTCNFITNYITKLEDGFVVDIGANIGLHTLPMAASRKAPNVGVIAFEANPDMVAKLSLNLALNNYPNVQVYSLGLNDREGVFELGLPYAEDQNGYINPGIASMSNFEYAVRKIEIECKTLDNVLTESGFGCDKIKLIKLDAEGKEINILKGAEAVLSKSGPAIIVEHNANFEQIHELLSGYGYIQIGSLLRSGIERDVLAENVLFIKNYENKKREFDI